MKKIVIVWAVIFLFIYFFCPYVTIGGTSSGTEIIDEKSFIDDVGNYITIEKPCKKIISLFDEHTENLYYIGAEDCLTGISDTSTFPAEVNSLPKYKCGNNYDAEQILKEKPDVVLSAPEINEKYPAFITKLETNGIFVVSLRPDDLEEYDIYLQKLGIITGHQKDAEKRLKEFHKEIDEIKLMASKSKFNASVFIESSESGYFTPSLNTLPYNALKINSVTNVAEKKLKHRDKEKNIYFGIKRLNEKKDEIDHYILLRGGGNTAASKVSMYQKEQFRDFKAVKENEVYEINEKILDSYSFRYLTGLKEIGRICHPDVFCNIDEFRNDEKLTRKSFSEIVYRYLEVPTFINTKKEYYDYKRFNHLYGTFEDVTWDDEDFNVIETVVMREYIDFSSDDNNLFERDKELTKAEIASFINILCDIRSKDTNKNIKDLPEGKEGNIVQKVVDNNLMTLENGYFRPEENLTNNDFVEILDYISKNRTDLL